MKLIAGFLILLANFNLSYGKSAEELLKASDRARGSVEKGLSWVSEVTTTENGRENKKKFKVRAQYVNAYVEAIEPARNKGEIYLFNDRTMWFFKPSLRKPVTISPRQKLSGQAANGDIASTHYSRDYIPKIEREDQIDGEKTKVLLLKAKANNLTYDQIRYWIREKDQLAIQAEFLTLQGKVFKRAKMKYDNQVKGYEGSETVFISEIEISDAKMADNKSIIRYIDPKIDNLKESLFNVNNLKR
jgi:outer membrane lipoprotein-sorting protein